MNILGFTITRTSSLEVEAETEEDRERTGTPFGMKSIEELNEQVEKAPVCDPDHCRNDAEWLQAFAERRELRVPLHSIAEDCSVPKWRLYDDTDPKKPVELHDHPLLDLWNAPHPRHPNSQYIYLSVVYLYLCGSAPVLMQKRDADGKWVPIGTPKPTLSNGEFEFQLDKPERLKLIPPSWVESSPAENGKGIYEIKFPGKIKATKIPAHAVMDINRPDVRNPYGFGLGPARALKDEIALGRAMSKFSIRNFLNGTFLGNIISMPLKGLKKKIVRAWKRRYSGVENVGKDIFVDANKETQISVTPVGQNMEEIAFIESRNQNTEYCNQGFQVPPPRVGILGDANRSTVDVTDQHQQTYNVLPNLSLIRDFANMMLTVRWGKHLRLDFDNPVKETEEALRKRAESGIKNGYLTPNQALKAFGLELLPPEIGDVLYVPTNNVTIVPITGKAPNEDPNDEPDPEEGSDAEAERSRSGRKDRSRYNLGRRSRFVPKFNSATRSRLLKVRRQPDSMLGASSR